MEIILLLLISLGFASPPTPGQIPHLRCAHKLLAPNDSHQKQIAELDQKIDALSKTYSDRLGIHRDPFAAVFTTEEGEKVYRRLKIRKVNGASLPSTLSLLIDKFRHSFIKHDSFDEAFVIDSLSRINEDLTIADKLSTQDLQSNLVALKYAREYLNRYRVHEPIDIHGDPINEEKKKEQDKEKEKQKKGEPPPPPEYPDLPEDYTPSTENTDNEPGESQSPTVIAEANFVTHYFTSGHFTRINRMSKTPFEQGELPGAIQRVDSYQHTNKKETLQLLGRKDVILFIPPGYRPLQPADTRAQIRIDSKGNYHLKTTETLAQVEIQLAEDSGITLSPLEHDFLTLPVGFDKKEWPDIIQAEIFRKFSVESAKQNPLPLAKALSQLIAHQYLYSVGPRPELDPIEAMKSGAFQCSMASYAMAAILRDVYQIPTRVSRGFRAKLHKGGRDGKSYLVIPGEAHVWIEVFHNGKWHPFDPTPVKQDKKKKNEGEKSEYSDVPEENSESDSSDQTGEESEQQSSSAGEGESKNHKERIEKETEQRKQSTEKKTQTEAEKKQSMEASELLKNMELGSLGLKATEQENPLWNRLMRTLTRIIVEPTRSGDEITSLLNLSRQVYKDFPSPELMQLYQEASSIHSPNHPRTKEWVEDILYQLKKAKITDTYQKLYKLERSLILYGKLLDAHGTIPQPTELLAKVRAARIAVKSLEHANSADITLVQSSTEHLPSVAYSMLKEDFDFSNPGLNSPTEKLAKELRAGHQNDLRLLNILSPLSDFILNSTPRPEYTEIKQLERDPKKNRGTDIMPAVRFPELTRSFMGQPHKTPIQNFRDRTAYVRTRQKTVRVPRNYGNQTAERITIVLYDTSGSMQGDPARFQAGLISAFTAKALSDVDPWGRHRHRVLIIPFDSEPKSATKVTTVAEALGVIRNYQSKLANTNGGTNIQKAILEAYAQIADAEKRKGEPLASANIVLMTDGQDKIEPSELMRARNAIDRDTPIQLFFAAIGTTNDDLRQFAFNSGDIGGSSGDYREYSAEAMNEILKDADTIRSTKTEADFYTDKIALDIPKEVEHLLSDALDAAIEYQGHLITGNRYRNPSDLLFEVEGVEWHNIVYKERALENWLIRVRTILNQSTVFKDKKIRERVVEDLVKSFEQVTHVKMNDLSNHEQEHLKHLLRDTINLH